MGDLIAKRQRESSNAAGLEAIFDGTQNIFGTIHKKKQEIIFRHHLKTVTGI